MSDRNSTYVFLFYGTLSGVALGVLSFVNRVNNGILTGSFAIHRYRSLSNSILFCAFLGSLTALCIRVVLFEKNMGHRISCGFILLLLLMVWLFIFGAPSIRVD